MACEINKFCLFMFVSVKLYLVFGYDYLVIHSLNMSNYYYYYHHYSSIAREGVYT